MTAEDINRLISGVQPERKTQTGFNIKDYLPKTGINSSEMKDILKKISDGTLPQSVSHPNPNAK